MGRNISLKIDIANLAIAFIGLLLSAIGIVSWKQIFPPPWSKAYFYCSQITSKQSKSNDWIVWYNKEDVSYPWLQILHASEDSSPEAECVRVAERLETYRKHGLVEFAYDDQSPPSLCAKTRRSGDKCMLIYILASEEPEVEFHEIVEPLMDDSALVNLSSPSNVSLREHLRK